MLFECLNDAPEDLIKFIPGVFIVNYSAAEVREVIHHSVRVSSDGVAKTFISLIFFIIVVFEESQGDTPLLGYFL